MKISSVHRSLDMAIDSISDLLKIGHVRSTVVGQRQHRASLTTVARKRGRSEG